MFLILSKHDEVGIIAPGNQRPIQRLSDTLGYIVSSRVENQIQRCLML